MKKIDGGPAFPCIETSQNNTTGETVVNQWSETGLTVRDYFAAKAMQGICASGPGNQISNDAIAKESYALSDAMLRARGDA